GSDPCRISFTSSEIPFEGAPLQARSSGRRATSRQIRVESAVDQDERDAARLAGAVRPSMVRAPLDHDVARANHGLAFVDDQRDLALENDAVVDRLGTVHEGMPRAAGLMRRRVRGADLGEMGAGLLGAQLADARVLGRYVQHPDARAVLRRRERDAVLVRLAAVAIDERRRLARVPDLVEQRTEIAADPRDARRRPVLDDYGPALGVVARDDAAKRCSTHCAWPPEKPAGE